VNWSRRPQVPPLDERDYGHGRHEQPEPEREPSHHGECGHCKPTIVVELGPVLDKLIAPVITRLEHIGRDLIEMRILMATQNEQLTELKTGLVAVFADFDAKLDQLNAQTDTFTPEAQATFDSLKQAVADKQAELGDVDGSDSAPAEGEPGTDVPAEQQPAVDGSNPVA
jgi:hypothetical protein